MGKSLKQKTIKTKKNIKNMTKIINHEELNWNNKHYILKHKKK